MPEMMLLYTRMPKVKENVLSFLKFRFNSSVNRQILKLMILKYIVFGWMYFILLLWVQTYFCFRVVFIDESRIQFCTEDFI